MGITAAVVGAAAASGSKLLGARASARSRRSQAAAEERVAQINARQAERLAEDAISRGDREAGLLSGKADRIIGEQLASYAASGVDVSSPSVLAVAAETKRLVLDDIVTIKTNALREAYGLKSQASSIKFGARLNTLGQRAAAKQEVISGTLDATSSALGSAFKLGAFDSGQPDTVLTPAQQRQLVKYTPAIFHRYGGV